MCVRVCVLCVCACVRARVRVCAGVCVCVYVYVYVYVFVHVYVHVYVYVYVYVFVFVYVYMYVCACVKVGVNVCSQVGKILKKNRLYDIGFCQSNSAGFIFLLDLDHFQGQVLAFYLICEYLVSDERWSKHYHCNQTGSHVFAIEWRHCECCTHDLDLHVRGHTFRNVNISKTVRTSDKYSCTTLIVLDVCLMFA